MIYGLDYNCSRLKGMLLKGVQVYRKFYTEEKEMSNGVLAISVSKLPLQPCDLLAGMLFGLNKGGLQGLLGLAHTTGTIPEALPPSKSTLLSSFMLPYKLNVEHSTLTHGARALAKHAEQSSSKYWGTIDGNDSNKNRLALDVISRLMTHCCWLNVHIVQPHGAIFEIRVAEGYGARWSSDGSKFIGFLEPYMEHSKRWMHEIGSSDVAFGTLDSDKALRSQVQFSDPCLDESLKLVPLYFPL